MVSRTQIRLFAGRNEKSSLDKGATGSARPTHLPDSAVSLPSLSKQQQQEQQQEQHQSSSEHENSDIDEKTLAESINASVDEFLNTLTADDQALFQATTLATELLKDLQDADQQHKERSYGRKVAAAIKPFVDGVEHYGKAWDVLANTSDILSPIWASARVLLKMASDFGEYFTNLSRMFTQIGRHLISVKRYPILYPDNDILQASMVEIFQAIFAFLTKASKIFSEGRHRSKSMRMIGSVSLSVALHIPWRSFKSEFGDIVDTISRCMEDIETEVDIAEKELANEERKKAEEERLYAKAERDRAEKERSLQARERFRRGATMALVSRASIAWMEFIDEKSAEKVNTWLAPVNVANNHNAATKARHADTGRWFLEGPAFQKWLRDDSSFMWLHAIPGAGKTVLTSTIINYLREHVQSSRVGLAYFYCDYREIQKQQPLKLISNILSMLSTQNRAVFLKLQTFFQNQYHQNPAYTPTFDELVSNFGAFTSGCFERILVVVDALDECDDRDCSAYCLRQIYETCPNVKVLVTSRNEADIAESFENLTECSMEEKDVSPDIENYIKAELATRIEAKKLKLRDEKLAGVIVQSLVEGAKGMFQWAKCQIEHVCKLRNDKAIRGALLDLPKTLHDTYFRVLQGIQKRGDDNDDDIRDVQRILRWLVRGVRNMTLDELAHCISIDPEGDEESLDFDAIMTDPSGILELCGSLVSRSADGYVSIAHYSAKEFLVSADLKDRMPQFWVGGAETETELATVCLKYLCYDDFSQGALDTNEEVVAKLDEYKALKYAANAWPTHAQRGQANGPRTETITNLAMQLFNAQENGNLNFDIWKQVYYFKTSSRTLIPRASFHPLYCATFFGLAEVVEQLLAEKAPDDCSEYLKVAATGGHTEVVKTFLKIFSADKRPNLNAAFYAASAAGHVDIVQLLLDEGIDDINARIGKDGTAMQAAALEGEYDVISLLIKHKADIQTACKRWGTPLAAAAEKGHTKTVRTLLSNGANPNARGGWYCWPIISAVVGKNWDIVEAILEMGGNVNAQGGRHGSALMAAAALGMYDFVSMLITREKAKVNDEDDKGSDALYAACVSGHLNIVNLLIDLGADVNAKGGKHRNALNAASAEGRLDIVRRLIEVGVDLHCLDEHVGNALQIAAYKGHIDIVKVLSEAGLSVYARGGDRGTALESAASGGRENVIELLFELGVRKGKTGEMINAIVLAAEKGHENVVRVLMDAGASLNRLSKMKSPAPRTPLEAACFNGHVEVAKLLLEGGAEVNCSHAESSLGFPLLAAVASKTPSVVMIETLLKAGANPNLTVSSTVYPTHGFALPAAIDKGNLGNLKIVQLLIKAGCDVNLVHENYPSALQQASGLEDQAIMDYLLSSGADPNLEIKDASYKRSCHDSAATPLQNAAYCGREENVRKLVKAGAKFATNEDDKWFRDALQIAAYYGKVDVVKTLIELGCEVDRICKWSGTALLCASENGYNEVINLLVDAGADVNRGELGPDKLNALIAAAKENKHETVKLLIDRGADPNKKSGGRYQYPLHASAENGAEETIKILLENAADPNATGGRYGTALAAVCGHGYNGMKELIEAGANPNIVAGQFSTPLVAAYSRGFYKIIYHLYEHKADNSIIGLRRTQQSAMATALARSCKTLVTYLVIHHKFDLNLSYGVYDNALQNAIIERFYEPEIFDLFVRNDANVNKQGGRFSTPLTAAAATSSMEIVETLLERGADPNLQGNTRFPNALYGAVDSPPVLVKRYDQRGKIFDLLKDKGCEYHGSECTYGTPIQRAASKGKFQMVRKLIKWGVDPDAFSQTKYGTSLQAASEKNHAGLVNYFLNRPNVNVNKKGGRLGNPLSSAVLYCSPHLVELLLKKGAQPNQRGGKYAFTLQAAAAAGRLEILPLLLRYGSDVNSVGGKYGTALQAGVLSGNIKIVKCLVEHGASPNIEAGLFRTPLQAAVLLGDKEIAVYLIRAGATCEALDRKHIGHRNEEQFKKAEELLKAAKEEASREGSGDLEEEDEEEPSREPLFLNVTSIPGHDKPYVPRLLPVETTVIEDGAVPKSALELCAEFGTDVISLF